MRDHLLTLNDELEAFGQDLLWQIAGLSQGGQSASKRQKQTETTQEVVMLDSTPSQARPGPFPRGSTGGKYANCEATLNKLKQDILQQMEATDTPSVNPPIP